jgi:small subunit ribosomal protein S1
MDRLLGESEFLPEELHAGDIVEGRVVRKDTDQIIVDVGIKTEAVVPASDLERLDAKWLDSLHVGDSVPVYILRPPGRPGDVLVSIFQASTHEDWRNAADLMKSEQLVELEIVGHNRGGLVVQLGRLQGFVPRSQLAATGARRWGHSPKDLEAAVGDKMFVKVVEVDRRQGRLILSEKAAWPDWRRSQRQRLLEELRPGHRLEGIVRAVTEFGVFVDLGGADGLVHRSEISYDRERLPKDLVKVGQMVEVSVLSVDRERGRIALSMKRLKPDPWQRVASEFYVGQLVDATVSNLTDYGAFAHIEEGLDGLIHISELADRHVQHPSEVVKPGQRLTLQVLTLDPERRRIGLSLKRVPEQQVSELPELEPVERPLSRRHSARPRRLGDERRVGESVLAAEAEFDGLAPATDVPDSQSDAAPVSAGDSVGADHVQLEAPSHVDDSTDSPAQAPADDANTAGADADAPIRAHRPSEG